MHPIFIIFLITGLSIVGFIIYLLYLIKNKKESILPFLNKFIWIIFGFVIFFIIFLIITSLSSMSNQFIFYIYTLQISFQVILYWKVFKELRFLTKQLKDEIIFERKNVVSLISVGKSFIILTCVEIITGLALGVINLKTANENHFSLNFSITTFIYVSIGLLLMVISFIYEKAIDIYEENQLTI